MSMGEWADRALGEVLTLQRGFDLPKRLRQPGPYPVVSSAGVTGFHIEFKVHPPGVVIGRYGSLGSVHWVEKPFWPLNTALWVKDFKGNDARFLSYLLQTVAVDGSTASAVPGVNRNHLHKVLVRVPCIQTQKHIAAVLSAFDELIEINERRIELLEDLARSLYQEWFVHFRFPGHEGVKFVDSELGSIPQDWSVERIKDVTSNVTRGIAPKYSDDGRWTVLNQRCIRHQRVTFSPARRHEGPVTDAKRLRFGDVLINSTGVGTLGRVAVLLVEPDSITVDSHVTIARPASSDLHPWFGLHMLGRESAFQAMGTGSTGQTELGRAAVGELPVAVPSSAVLAAFGDVAWSLLRPIPLLSAYCDELAQARDLLLPRLVSGQLNISDVDLGVLAPAETG
jgi:type I restriction enzyme, S subunit